LEKKHTSTRAAINAGPRELGRSVFFHEIIRFIFSFPVYLGAGKNAPAVPFSDDDSSANGGEVHPKREENM